MKILRAFLEYFSRVQIQILMLQLFSTRAPQVATCTSNVTGWKMWNLPNNFPWKMWLEKWGRFGGLLFRARDWRAVRRLPCCAATAVLCGECRAVRRLPCCAATAVLCGDWMRKCSGREEELVRDVRILFQVLARQDIVRCWWELRENLKSTF